jgi:hypothetical protein
MTHHRLVAVLLAFACLAPPPVAAQYFGRNKVQYKDFDFKVLETERFRIYFYPEEQEAAAQAARLAERWYERLSRVLQHKLAGKQPLILYASHPDFEQTNVIQGELSEGTGGVTEMMRRRIVLPLAGPLAETDHVIGHELVHAFQFDITAPNDAARGQASAAGADRLPLWFMEGMAEYLSIGHEDPHTAMWMRDAVTREALPAIKDLNDPKYFPYRWGHALWAFIAGRWGDRAVGDLLRAGKLVGDPDEAFQAVLGLTAEQLSAEWHAALRSAYARAADRTRPPSAFGRLLVGEEKLGGELNVSPAVSPDGRTVAFLSERDLFSIDLFLADAETGRVLRRITETAIDPHTSSLQFIRSAAAWSPDSLRLAVPAIRSGRPALLIVNAETGGREREIRLDSVDEVFNPAWSPSGRAIAFSATTGGYTDLFIHDLQSGQTTRLTSDPFADLQPAWSPDGSAIAFVTDRFSTRLSDLKIGPYRLATIRPAAGTIEPLRGLGGSKHISPQWSADGRRIYFLSDFAGATNIYALTVADGTIVQITNLLTGVSGITASSPALSAAAKAHRLAFSAFERGAYRLYAVDTADVLAGGPVAQEPAVAAALPPFSRRESTVPALLDSATVGLPPTDRFPVEEYRPRLALDYVGQPTIAAGVDRFGTFAGGGLAFFFSDMLGNHNLATAVQLNSSFSREFTFKDTAALVAYQNLEHRWNWAVSAEQVPYLSGAIGSAIVTTEVGPALLEERQIFRQVNHALTGIVAYPFSRAQRLEVSGGLRRIGFDETLERTFFSLDTGQVIGEDSVDLPAAGALNLGQASAALVYDTSIFGATSPVLGQRYRLEWTPTAGSITFQNVLADYRRYIMPARFYTIAFRGLHFGRYGGDAEHPLLTPLFLGYPTLVRGYDIGSFDSEDCPEVTGSCAAFDRLIGSRLLVANAELRFPLFRPFGLRPGMYGPIPAEVALFADAGVAWDRHQKPSFIGGDRRPVSSVGAALRVNILGFAIAQIDFVRPLDRRTRGWMWQFSFAPGF